jgi:hypothetical protein
MVITTGGQLDVDSEEAGLVAVEHQRLTVTFLITASTSK